MYMHACSYQCSNGYGSPMIPSLSSTYLHRQCMGNTNFIRVVTFATLVAWLVVHKSPIAEDRQTNRPSQHSSDIVINDIMQTYKT